MSPASSESRNWAKKAHCVQVTGFFINEDYFPEGYERCHPYSGMKNKNIDDPLNFVDVLRPSINSTVKIERMSIESCISTFYRKVFKNAQTPTSKQLFLNIFGGYMESGVQTGYHMGVDIFCGKSPVLSAHKGKLIILGSKSDVKTSANKYGTVGIYDEENDVTYLYLHLRELIDKPIGSEIKVGDQLGIESNKGLAIIKDGVELDNNIHLHFEVRKGKCNKDETGNNPISEIDWNKYPMKDSLMLYRYMLIHF